VGPRQRRGAYPPCHPHGGRAAADARAPDEDDRGGRAGGWPKDAGDREKGSGEPIKKLYKDEGLRMLDVHATWPDGSISTEAGILEWDERERTGRLKVARHLSEWLEERRFYHRKDGQIVKIKDDLMSATRFALMMKRYAKAVTLGARRALTVAGARAAGSDFDLFTGA
jgi:hypothetical protein